MAETATETMTPKDGKPAKVRQRRAHTRSRMGCAECKARRVRCDEQRPTCQNCIKSKRICEYPPVKIPLRERRILERAGVAQPWEPTPWDASTSSKQPELPSTPSLVRQLILSASKKNLDCLSINMPLKSHELFHYFYRKDKSVSASPADHSQECMAHIISDPEALRSAVLIAATHFAFKVGSLKNFEQTFYFHKLKTVRLVKEWFAKGDLTLSAAITKQMAILAYTEVCRGDFQMAEKHLSAIYALSRHTEEQVTTGGKTMDQELSDRYFILTSTFMHGITTTLDGTRRAAGLTEAKTSSSSSDAIRYINNWHTTDSGHYFHTITLKAIRMFSVTSNYKGEKLEGIPLTRVLQGLHILTRNFYDGHSKPSPRSPHQIQDDFWQSETTAMLYDGLIEAHQNSVSKNHTFKTNTCNESEQKASWIGLAVATELYLEQVVVLWRPFTRDNYLYTMRILQRDLSYTLQKPDAPQLAELLFWQSFVAVLSLQMHEKQGDLAKEPGIRPYFEGVVRNQSQILGSKTWKDAKAALLRIAWPCDFTDDDHVKGIWEAVMVDEAVAN